MAASMRHPQKNREDSKVTNSSGSVGCIMSLSSLNLHHELVKVSSEGQHDNQ